MVHLAIHCGPTGGTFGCDPGDLPAPPAAAAWLLFALGILGLVLGAYMLIAGRPLVRIGMLKGISTIQAVRLLGFAMLISSIDAVLIARFVDLLSQHLEPPRWSTFVLFPITIAVPLVQWFAIRMDRSGVTRADPA